MKAFKLHIQCNSVAELVFWSPSNWALWEAVVCRRRRAKFTLVPGCWFLLSNLFTSPIHNIFTGYFFKKCIGRVLKTTRGLLIMNNAPRCSVRCLPNSWQQCLSIIGLPFFFFYIPRERERGGGRKSQEEKWKEDRATAQESHFPMCDDIHPDSCEECWTKQVINGSYVAYL